MPWIWGGSNNRFSKGRRCRTASGLRTLVAVWTVLKAPKWIVLTLLVPIAMALCLLAADWQYQRHLDRRATVAQVEALAELDTVPIADVVSPGRDLAAQDRYRQVVATGQYSNESLLVRKRVFEGKVGFWVVTPLRTSDGQLLQVLRGWLPQPPAGTMPSVPPAPTGPVTVVGWLDPSQVMPEPIPSDLPAGQIAALDTSYLAAGSSTYLPFLVAQAMEPPQAAGLTTLPVPNPGLGPHLAYSWQWLVFAGMIPVGWFVLFRRDVKEHRADQAVQSGQSPTFAA